MPYIDVKGFNYGLSSKAGRDAIRENCADSNPTGKEPEAKPTDSEKSQTEHKLQ